MSPIAARVLVLALLLFVAACGNSAERRADTGLTGLDLLPAPQSILAGLERTVAAAPIAQDGADFLPNTNNAVTVDGAHALFQPATAPGEEHKLASHAYALYQFDADGFLAPAITFGGELEEPDSYWYGAADFVRNTWTWQHVTDIEATRSFTINLEADMLASDGTVLVAVVVRPLAAYRLERVTLSGLGETEDNDTLETANDLEVGKTAFLRGSTGERSGQPTYDGDLEDWFSLGGVYVDQQVLYISIGGLTAFAGDNQLEVYNAAGAFIDDGFGFDGQADLELIYGQDFSAADLPLKIRVFCEDPIDGDNYILRYRTGFQPAAQLMATPKIDAQAPITVTLDASGTTDADGDIVSYTFFFGDDSDPIVSATPTVQHEYAANGVYDVRVRVTDESGFTSEADDVLFFGDNPYDEIEGGSAVQWLDPLKAESGWLGNLGSTNPDLGEPEFFAYDGSSVDVFRILVPAGQTIGFHVEQLNGAAAFFAYSEAETGPIFGTSVWYNGTQVTNSTGAENAFEVSIEADSQTSISAHGEYKLTWSIGTPPNAADFTYEITGPREVTFHGTASDADGTIVRYEWDFNDDKFPDATGQDVVHVFPEDADTDVDMIAFDNDGLARRVNHFVNPE
jgi:hypothetical protein